jgi:hypothetical protein
LLFRVHSWLKQKPHRRLAMGFDKSRERIRTLPPRGTTAARLAADSDSNCDSLAENYAGFGFASNVSCLIKA